MKPCKEGVWAAAVVVPRSRHPHPPQPLGASLGHSHLFSPPHCCRVPRWVAAISPTAAVGYLIGSLASIP